MTDRSAPASWKFVLAFGTVYTAWGTTYLAIKAGVRTLPPGLFGGTRILCAGLLILLLAALRGTSLRLSRQNFLVAIAAGIFLFAGGNGLVTLAQRTVDSGVTSVLIATTPLWIALIESLWPQGERLSSRSWLGLLVGLGGVVLLLIPRLQQVSNLSVDPGYLLVFGSAMTWAVGSVILRYGRRGGSPFVSAAYQMVLGGLVQMALGLASGEAGRLTTDMFTPTAIFSFFYLLVVGSLVGFLAYTWLLQHVSATMAGTYAYVNPGVAVLVGWLVGGEEVTVSIVVGLVIILAGVALVRAGAQAKGKVTKESPESPRYPATAQLCRDS